jgi:hypothetical protein
MTDQELKDLVASLASNHAALTEKHAALADKHAALAEAQQDTQRQMKETGQFLKEVGRQIGGLGEKFGSFTEGLALPSMTRILQNDFGMQVIAPRVTARNNGHSLEVDVLAYSNTSDDVYVVEVKSHLREDSLDQMRRILRDFRSFFPVHRDKKIYGILAAVDAPEAIRDKVLREGIYLARVHDGHFEVQVPETFQPHAF